MMPKSDALSLAGLIMINEAARSMARINIVHNLCLQFSRYKFALSPEMMACDSVDLAHRDATHLPKQTTTVPTQVQTVRILFLESEFSEK